MTTKTKDILTKATRIVAFVLCACIMFSFISAYCERKTYNGSWNYMSKLNEFYGMKKNSLDYIGVGSSHMYCTLNPLEVWNETGAAGFVLATQQQPLRASYHYIKEALRTQSPKYVILEGYMICGESTYDNAVLYDAIDPLRFSLNKIEMINSLVEYDKRPDFYFNVLKYHTRWNSLTPNEVNVLFDEHIDTYKGFVALDGNFEGQNIVPDYENTKDIELSEFNTDILNDIYDLVEKSGAELVVMFAPYDASNPALAERTKALTKWAEGKGVDVLDYSTMFDELDIDPANDYFDGGHLDCSGAAKVSVHFADYLADKGVGKNELIDTEKWQEDYNAYVAAFPGEIAD
ncbi:MAG: hypothetical protein IKL24_05160 [Clostridia bacterium]|nr:hypothetical protein [Clostridia bacterium]